MATVESDSVPSTVQPITTADDTNIVASPDTPPIDASETHLEKDQQSDSTDTQLPANGDATSSPEVTKLPPDQLDIAADALLEAKKLADTPEPTVIVDADLKATKEQEDATAIHSKDSTADTNISNATTAVEHESEDTPKDDTENGTHQHEDVGLGASTTEGALIGSVESHDTVTEVAPAAVEELPPTAESSTSESEPVPGPVAAESDPVISTTGETEAHVAEPEPSEHVQHTVDETPEVPNTEDSPTINSADVDNADHKTDPEVEDDPITVHTATELHDEGKVAEGAVEVPEGESAEVDQPSPTIHIETAEQEVDRTETSTHSLLNAESPIGVEIVAPTPALVDDRDLEESDTEDTTAQHEGSSTPTLAAEEDLVPTGGTVTPQPEPEADVPLITVEEDDVGADTPVVEVPPSIEDSETIATATHVDAPEETAIAEAPTVEEETSIDVTPAAEEPHVDTPEVEATPLADPTPETPSTEEQPIASEAPAVTTDEPVAIHDIPTVTVEDEPAAVEGNATTSIPEEHPAEEQPTSESDATEAVSVPETSVVADVEVPDANESVSAAPEVETPAAVEEETPVAEEIQPAEEPVELREVEEEQQQKETVTVEDTPVAEMEPSVEDTQALREPPVELVAEAQEAEDQVSEGKPTEPAEEQVPVTEPEVPEVSAVPEESAAIAALDQDTPPTQEVVEEAPVLAVDEAVSEEAEPEAFVTDSTTEPLVAEESVGEANAEGEVVEEEPAAVGEEPIIEEPVAELTLLAEPVPEPISAEEPTEPVTASDAVQEETKAVQEEPVAEEPVAESAVLAEPVPEVSSVEEPTEPAITPDAVEEITVEKGEEAPTEEASVPETSVSQPEVVPEEQVVEERAVDETTTHDISIPVEKSTEDPVVEAAAEAEAVVEPVVGEPTETTDAHTPAVEEPAIEGIVAEPVAEVPTTEASAVSDEPSVQEGHAVEEKSSDKDTEEQMPQAPVFIALEDPAVPEAAAEPADVENHTAEADIHPETADPVLSEEPALPVTADLNEEPVLDDSPIESDPTPETGVVPEVIVEEDKDSSEPVLEEPVIENTPAVETEAIDGSVAQEKPALDIPEDAPQVERPWTPSFQVTTIGQGASLPADEDIPTLSPDDGVEETKDVPPPQPAIVVEDEPTEAGVDEVQAPIEQTVESESSSLSWTPSYSVHSQGSPSPTHASLEPETPAADNDTHESAVAPEGIVTTAEKESEPSMDTETPDFPSVPQEEPKLDEPQITDEPELPRELQITETVVPVVEEPEAQTEAPTQEEVQDKEPEPLHAVVTEDTFVKDVSSLTPPTEQDRPASPSWVPSYSVSRQGSPLPQQAPVPIADAHIPEIELTSDPTHTVDAEVAKEQDREEDTSPAPPTVTVDNVQPKATEENVQVEEDRSSATWTPSYSVTHQGTDVLKETQLESLTSLGQPDRPELRRSLSEEVERSSAFSTAALIGAGVAGGTAVLAASASFGGSKDAQSDTDTKHNDGRPANGKAVSSPEALQDRVFPTVEIPSDTNSRLSTAPLPALDENSALDTTSPLSPETSPVLSRKRLESTTSSRLFPGGWFSNTSKIPDERTSLEVAQGVFTPTKQGSAVEETLLSPAVDPITPVREQSSSDKRRWCVIM